MIISHKYKFIFIKTRKVAGSSIEYILRKHLGDNDIATSMPYENIESINTPDEFDQEHAKGFQIKEKFPYEWKNYYKFTVERNPWDKTVSMFYFHKKIKPHKVKRGFNFYILNPKVKFENNWGYYTIDNFIIVDKILFYENLNNDLKNTFDHLLIPYNNELNNIKLKGNLRSKENYRIYYNQETKEIVYRAFKEPIEKFNYTF